MLRIYNWLTGGLIGDLTAQRDLYREKVRELWTQEDKREKLFNRYQRRMRFKIANLEDDKRRLQLELKILKERYGGNK
jgi:hypothetical protein